MGMYRPPTEQDKGKKRLCLICKAIVPIEDQYCWRCGVKLWNDFD